VWGIERVFGGRRRLVSCAAKLCKPFNTDEKLRKEAEGKRCLAVARAYMKKEGVVVGCAQEMLIAWAVNAMVFWKGMPQIIANLSGPSAASEHARHSSQPRMCNQPRQPLI
jgi:hypothetical protein